MTEHDERHCELLLVARRVLAMHCVIGNLLVIGALVLGALAVVPLAALCALAMAVGMLACDARILRLQGRDRRGARV